MTFARRCFAVALAALALASSGLGAPLQGQRGTLTLESLHGSNALAGSLPEGLAWHPDSRRLTLLRRPSPEGPVDLVALDAGSGKEQVLLGADRVKHPVTGQPLALDTYAWAPGGDELLVSASGDLFMVGAKTGVARALTRTPEVEEFPQVSPDGKWVGFVRANDLYAVELRSGREIQLTKTGSPTILNGCLDWVYEEELGSRNGRAWWWSPASDAIAYLQLDQARVPTFPIVDFIPVHNELQSQRYPKAGDPNAVVQVGVVGLTKEGAAGPERLSSVMPDDAYVVPDLSFTSDGRNLAYMHLNRPQNELQLRLVAIPDSPGSPLGPPRTVLTERSPDWLNAPPAPIFLKDGRRFLWLSERTGFAHLYLCEPAGACRAVTQGSWMVDAGPSFAGASGSLQLEERTGFVYFVATEKDPRERHLYRTRLDGTGRSRLTREDGTHKVLLSPDARHFADTRSSLESPPAIVVSSADGLRALPVPYDRNPDLSFERARHEWVELKARDGAALYGRLLKPAGFDPAKRHPAIVRVYGGPGVQLVRNSWDREALFEQLLASRGFLVFSLDNRGSTGRGHAFEAPLFKDMGRTELEDQLAGVAYLKSLAFVDPQRLGIYGWSYGGYLTLYALTRAPDVFKAGVAGAPVTDWRFYDTIYTERYMGTPKDNPKGYEAGSPVTKAADLKAELLILHGTSDDNVHLANSLAFADALLKAGRPHALMLHPRQKHAFSPKEHLKARDAAILRHFETYLRP
jgi:dipeptidyl-peptidase-4